MCLLMQSGYLMRGGINTWPPRRHDSSCGDANRCTRNPHLTRLSPRLARVLSVSQKVQSQTGRKPAQVLGRAAFRTGAAWVQFGALWLWPGYSLWGVGVARRLGKAPAPQRHWHPGPACRINPLTSPPPPRPPRGSLVSLPQIPRKNPRLARELFVWLSMQSAGLMQHGVKPWLPRLVWVVRPVAF